MAAADVRNNTEQLQRFINNLWQHQQKKEFCDFTLTTNNTSIECHKLVLSSASSYFSQLLCDSEHNTNTIDVTPLPEHILRTVVAFLYNRKYVINDENVIELLKLSETWNLDVLAELCVTYRNDNITINNACRFYNRALDNADRHKSQIVNEFIREHFTSLHESDKLSELSLKNFSTILEQDEINVESEDVIFSTAIQIINQQTSVEDINRCLELIRFPHTSGDYLVNVILNHPLMKVPPRDEYVSEAILYQIDNKSIPDVKPPRNWGRPIYYINKDRCMYQYVSKAENDEFIKMMELPEWVNEFSAVASHKERVVIVGGRDSWQGDKRALLLDMSGNNKVTQLPDLPEPRGYTSVHLQDNDVYVIGGGKKPIDQKYGYESSVYFLSLGSDAWQTKKKMPNRLQSSLVIQHQQCIYVLGGYNRINQSSVSQYNIEDDTWKRCSDIPVAPGTCGNDASGVVVHEGRIKVITVDQCLTYADDTDGWTIKQYDKRIGDRVNAFVRRGQIWAVVRTHRTNICSMMSYDDVDNVWKTEHEKIDNAWQCPRLFC